MAPQVGRTKTTKPPDAPAPRALLLARLEVLCVYIDSVPLSARGMDRVGDRAPDSVDYKGYTVHALLGHRIGIVRARRANGRGKPEYLEVSTGRLGLWSILLPVHSVAVDEERRALVLE